MRAFPALMITLMLATPAFAGRPVARWDLVPDQRIAAPFKVGVVAFHPDGVKVEFRVNNTLVHTATDPTLNDRVNVWEYWFNFDPSVYADGAVTIDAKAICLNGTDPDYDLPSLNLYANSGGTLDVSDVKWADSVNGSDSNPGTEAQPYLTLDKAVDNTTVGGTIYLKAGTYDCDAINAGTSRAYWTTIAPASGLGWDDVEIASGRPKTDKLKLQNLSIFTTSTSGSYTTILMGEMGATSIWLDDVKSWNKNGRYAAQTFVTGNGYTAYTTGGLTTWTANGPAGSLIRDHTVYQIGSDVFSGGKRLIVNCTADDTDCGSTSWHPDFHQSYAVDPDWCEDVIMYNVKATNQNCQGFFGVRLRNAAFVNVQFERVPDVDFRSQYSTYVQNAMWFHITLVNQSWYWRGVGASALQATDVTLNNCNFVSMTLAEDATANGLTIDTNHFISTTTNMGTNITAGDTLYTDPAAKDYTLQATSPAYGTGKYLQCVPADVNGTPFDAVNRNKGAFAGVGGAPTNLPPVADAGTDQTVTDIDNGGDEDVTLDGAGSSDSDGSIASYVWNENSSQIGTGMAPTVTFAVGAHTVDLTVTDDDSATDTDSVLITVNAPSSSGPVADAGPDFSVLDRDGDGAEDVVLDGESSYDLTGSITSYLWEEGVTQLGTAALARANLTVGTHTITLTVTNDSATTDSDTIDVTVSALSGPMQRLTLGSIGSPRFTALTDLVWPANEGDVDICLWEDDKFAAASITIDDNIAVDHSWWNGLQTQYGWNFTWFVITGGIVSGSNPAYSGTWPEWNAMLALGHGVESHTWNHHSDDDTRPEDEVIFEYRDSQAVIRQNMPGNDCNFFAWPYGNYNPDIAKLYAAAARGVTGGPNKAQSINYLNTNSGSGNCGPDYVTCVLDGTSGITWMNNTGFLRGWMVSHFHQVNNKTEVEADLAYMATRESELWIGLFGDVAKYGQERDTATVNVTVNTASQIAFTISDEMDDIIYDYPLTIKVKLYSGWSGLNATQDGSAIPASIVSNNGDDYALVKAVPDQGLVVLTPDGSGNLVPTADAGTDQTIIDNDENGSEDVTLDGSGSVDPDGSIVSYLWEENSSQIATGVSPTVTLDVNVHTITLTVTDDDSATDTDTVDVTVAAPVTGQTYVIDGSTDDQEVRDNGTMQWIGQATHRVGGNTSTTDACSIYVFQLPALAGGETVTTANLDFELFDIDNSPGGQVDLYGIGYRASSTVQATDYYQGVFDGDTTDAWALQDDILTLGMPNPSTVSTDAAGDAALAAYIQAQYDAGAVGGEWVFLRLNCDVADQTNYYYWELSSANSTKPVLTIETGAGNAAPIADAGPDQNVTDSDDNGSEDVTLDGSGSSDSDGTLTSYVWEENSSQIATGVSPVVTLSVAVHTIDLIVTDDDSDTGTDSVIVTVNAAPVNVPPTANAGPDQNVTDSDDNGSEDVTLDGSGSSDSDGTITSYAWEENSSQIATGVSPVVTLSVAVHTIDLTVTDNDSDTDTDSVVVTVNAYVNVPPTANAGPDQNVTDIDDNGSEDVTLDGSGSSDSDGTITSYVWEENSSQIATGVSPTVTLSVAVHTIDLTVTDDDSDTDTDSVAVTVNAYMNVPPTADAGPDQNVTDTDDSGSEDVTLDGSGSSDSDGTIVSYDWEEASAPITTGVSPTVTFTVGAHTVDLTVTDDDSATDSDSVVITIDPAGSGTTYVINGHGDDRELRDDGTMTWVGYAWHRVGGSTDTTDSVAIYVFQLPTLGAGETISSANLDVDLYDLDNTPGGNVDLYGLGYRAASTVLTTDYYQGVFDGDATDAWALQDDYMTLATPEDIVSTDATGDAALAAYLTAQYDAGAQGGDYVFLRLNPDIANVGNYNYWELTSADSSPGPVLTIMTEVNAAPTADAGPDQTVTDTDDNGSENVTLDGSASADSDGTIVSYVWEESSSQIATGVNPTVTLDINVHTIDLTVTDDDAATGSDSVVITVEEWSATSSTTWQTFQFANQTAQFEFAFDMIPNNDLMDGVTGVGAIPGAWWSDLACVVRLAPTGVIDVRNGGGYAADAVVNYSAGTTYSVRMVINVLSHTYDAYVTPEGSSEVQLASGYAFRTEQASITNIEYWTLNATNTDESHTVSNVAVTFIPNNGPIADAGPDQNVTDTDDNGSEDVTLDGSASSDSDGTIVSYVWEENSSQIATGVSPVVTLDVNVHTIDLTVTDDDTATDADSVVITVDPAPITGPNLEVGVATGIDSSWTTVTLSSTYTSMVVVGVANYDVNTDPVVVRIQNASGNSFDICVDAAGGAAPNPMDVHWMVVEEGVYTQGVDGVTMEAVKFTSTVTDENNSWNGEARTYANAYTDPVVLGQVMTYNDADFMNFWCSNGSRSTPPSSSSLAVGKMVGEDPNTTRADETIGYIVIESGSGTINGIDYTAALGADIVKGATDAPPYVYNFSGLASPDVVVATLAAMDGNNGGWAMLYGGTPLTTTSIGLAIDEDQAGDTERSHTGEQVGYIVFDN